MRSTCVCVEYGNVYRSWRGLECGNSSDRRTEYPAHIIDFGRSLIEPAYPHIKLTASCSITEVYVTLTLHDCRQPYRDCRVSSDRSEQRCDTVLLSEIYGPRRCLISTLCG